MKAMIPLIALLLLIAAGCGDDDDMLVLTDTDSGQEVAVEAGQRFEVRLEANPSTGYAWELDEMSTPGVVTLVSREFVDPADEDVVGAPGEEVFVFESADAGAGVLRLSYIRASDDPVIPERVAEFVVRIDDAPWPPDDAGDPPGTSTATAGAMEIADLSGPTDPVTVAGFVVWDDSSARFCEVLAESFPPQCGGAAIPISNPEALDVTLEEEQGVRWTQGRIELSGAFDGTELTVG